MAGSQSICTKYLESIKDCIFFTFFESGCLLKWICSAACWKSHLKFFCVFVFVFLFVRLEDVALGAWLSWIEPGGFFPSLSLSGRCQYLFRSGRLVELSWVGPGEVFAVGCMTSRWAGVGLPVTPSTVISPPLDGQYFWMWDSHELFYPNWIIRQSILN